MNKHHHFIVSSNNPLPDPETIITEAFNLAWPEVLAWSAAATGVLLTVKLVKSFLAR